MKNKAINTLKYTGIVTLSQYIGSKKYKIAKLHNEGGNSLFNFLADCLIGDFTMARATRPTQVMLIERTNPDDEYAAPEYEQPSAGIGFIHLLTPPEKVYTTAGSRVRYSFIIPKEVVDNLTDFNNLYLGLYTAGADIDQPGDYAAICKLALSKNNIVSTSLVVDWELVISNISTAE